MEKDRRKELEEYAGDKQSYLQPLIESILFEERRIKELEKMPFLMAKGAMQKRTEASKLYISMKSQYIADIKALSFIAGKSESEETISPLREYMNSLVKE